MKRFEGIRKRTKQRHYGIKTLLRAMISKMNIHYDLDCLISFPPKQQTGTNSTDNHSGQQNPIHRKRTKYLGVTLDRYISYKAHIQGIAKKGNIRNCIIRKLQGHHGEQNSRSSEHLVSGLTSNSLVVRH